MVWKHCKKQLADLAFKMADENVSTPQTAFLDSDRPVHFAFLENKVPCGHHFCKGKLLFL